VAQSDKAWRRRTDQAASRWINEERTRIDLAALEAMMDLVNGERLILADLLRQKNMGRAAILVESRMDSQEPGA